MEYLIGILFISVVYLFFALHKLKIDLKEETSLFVEDDGTGGKIIRNGKGEIILEL